MYNIPQKVTTKQPQPGHHNSKNNKYNKPQKTIKA